MASDAAQRRSRWTRILLVDPRFQVRISLRFAVVGGAAAFMSSLAWSLSSRSGALQDSLLGSALEAVALGCATAAALALGGIFISHRIAGPLYAMTNYVSELAHGGFPATRSLRTADEFQDFFVVFQRAVEALRAKELDEAFKLQDAILRLAGSAQSPDARAALAVLQAIHDRKMKATHRGAERVPLPEVPLAPTLPPSLRN